MAGEQGFALVEAVVAVAVLGVVTAGAINAMRDESQSRVSLHQEVRSFNELRSAVNRLTAEVRQATQIRPHSSSRLEMQTVVGGAPAVVVYDASSGALTRTVGSSQPVEVVSSLVSTDVFCYGTGCAQAVQPTPAPGLVGVTLSTGGGQGTTLSTAVRPRVTLAG